MIRKLSLLKLIFIGILFISCNRNNDKNIYPSVVDSFGLQSVYNDIQWNLYCISCDDELKFIDSSIKDKITFGNLELRFDTIDTLGERLSIDTMEILFNFYYKGKKCDEKLVKNLNYYGAYVLTKSKKIYCYSTRRDFTCIRDSCIDTSQCRSRLVKPLQPEVINYINENKDKLAPWFYEEAKRRKVIKN